MQSSVLLYAGTFIGFLTTGLLIPRLLAKSEIGTLRLLQSYSAIFMSLGVLGFSTVTIRFVPRFYDKVTKKFHGFLGISMLVGTIGALLSVVLIFIIQPSIIHNNLQKSPLFAHYFILIIPLTVFQIYYMLLDSYNNALSRASYGVFLRDFIQRILILVLLLFMLFQWLHFDQYVYLWTVVICIPTILMGLHLGRHGALDLKIDKKFNDKSMILSMLSVSSFGLLNSFSSIAVIQIDTIMLNMYLDASTVGVYAITFYFGTLVLIPGKALNKIAPTLISKAYKENDLQTVKEIHYKSTSNLFLIACLILLGICVNLDNVFNIIPRSYEEGKFVIVLIGLANLVKMAAGSNDAVITYSRYYKSSTLFLFVLILLVIAFNLIFIPAMGMTGAAMASCLAIFLYNLIKFIFVKIKFGFNPFNLQFLWVIIFSCVIYWIVSLLPAFESFVVEIIIDSAITTLLFYLSIRFLPISDEINSTVAQLVGHFFRKNSN